MEDEVNQEGERRKRKAPKTWGDYETGTNYNCGQSMMAKVAPKTQKKKKKISPSDMEASSSSAPPAPAVPISAPAQEAKAKAQARQAAVKAQALDEVEEEIISDAFRRSAPKQLPPPPPEGASVVRDQSAALTRSISEAAALLLEPDWRSPPCQLIGNTCKVFWDGEDAWFYARILNYDKISGRHYIYYPEDSTAEWIDLEKECVLVGQRLVLARVARTPPWPALLFRASPSAAALCQNMRGYTSSGDYVEFFDENDSTREYGFLKSSALSPLTESFLPRKQNHRYLAALEAARKEKALIEEIISGNMKVVRAQAVRRLVLEQWVGIRVIAPTHRLTTREERIRGALVGPPPSVNCVGKVIAYCPCLEKHFVVFGPGLQPRWLSCSSDAELLLEQSTALTDDAPDKDNEAEEELELQPEPASSSHHLRRSNSNVLKRTSRGGGGKEISPSLSDADACEGHEGDLSETSAVEATHPQVPSCALCALPVRASSLSSTFDEVIMVCADCGHAFHESCLPVDKRLRPRACGAPPRILNGPWRCARCQRCTACGTSSWDRPLLFWNVQRADASAKEQWLLLCGLCLYGLKHRREFCTICYRLYPSTEESVKEKEGICGGPAKLMGPEQSYILPDSSGSSSEKERMEGEEPTVAAAVQEISLDDNCMIQCNECSRWIHALCEGLDAAQYHSITTRTHPVWGEEYLCPICRVRLSKEVLARLRQLDSLAMFAEPVTDDVAKGYFDTIRNPMDLATMRGKAERGHYKAMQAVRTDFELMCHNALLFNKSEDEYFKFAVQYFQRVTETIFGDAGKAVDGVRERERRTKQSAYGSEAQAIIQRYLESLTVSNATPKQPESAQEDAQGKRRARKRRAEEADSTEANDAREAATVLEQVEEETLDSEQQQSRQEQIDAALQAEQDQHEETEGSQKPATQKEEEEQQQQVVVVVPQQLTPCPEPSSYLAPTAFLQSCEEAYFTLHRETCFLCGSADDENLFLFCVDCGETMHSYCASAPVDLPETLRQGLIQPYSWRCMNCTLCHSCGGVSAQDVDNLVFCERCDAAYHTTCLHPPLPSSSSSEEHRVEDAWYCPRCVECNYCSKSATSAWGFVRDCCINCVENGQKEEKQKNCVMDAQPFELCVTCRSDVRGPSPLVAMANLPPAVGHFSCAHCSGKVHLSCTPYLMQEVIYRKHIFGDGERGIPPLLCVACMEKDFVAQGDGLANAWTLFPSSNSEGGDQEIHSKMHAKCRSLMISLRYCGTLSKIFAANQAAERARVIELTLSQRLLSENAYRPLATIIWATVRLMLMGRAPVSLANDKQFETLFPSTTSLRPEAVGAANGRSAYPSWLIVRARRFLNYFRRRSKLSQTSPMVLGQLSGLQLLTLSGSALSTLSLQAAAFTALCDKQEPHVLRSFVEVVIVVVEVALILTRQRGATAVLTAQTLEVHYEHFCSFSAHGATDNPSTGEIRAVGGNAAPISSPPISSISNGADGGKPAVVSGRSAANKGSTYRFNASEYRLVFSFTTAFLRQLGGLSPAEEKAVMVFLEQKLAKSFYTRPLAPAATPAAALNVPSPAVYLSKLKLLQGMQANRASLLQPPPMTTNLAAVVTSSSSEQPAIPAPPPTAAAAANAPCAPCMANKLLSSAFHVNEDPPAATASAVVAVVEEKEDEKATGRSRKKKKKTVADPLVHGIEFGPSFKIEPNELANLLTKVPHYTSEVAQEVMALVTEVQKEAMGTLAELDSSSEAAPSHALPNGPVGASLEVKADLSEAVAPQARSSSGDALFSSVALALDSAGKQVSGQDCGPYPHDPVSLLPAWQDPRICCLCQGSGSSSAVLLPFSDGYHVHRDCLLWSPHVIFSPPVLRNALEARTAALSTICHYCRQKGASVCCQHHRGGGVVGRKKCGRSYHIHCAIAARCILLHDPSVTKAIGGGNGDEDGHASVAVLNRHHIAYCPIHAADLQSLNLSVKPDDKVGGFQFWAPPSSSLPVKQDGAHQELFELSNGSPDSCKGKAKERKKSCILLEDNVLGTDSEELSKLWTESANPRALRMGALTVLSLGRLDARREGLCSTRYLFPQRFRAVRLFWSLSRPLTRTPILFDILYFEDLQQSLDDTNGEGDEGGGEEFEGMEQVQQILYAVHKDVATAEGGVEEEDPFLEDPESWVHGPIFRAIALDEPQRVVYAKSPQVLYRYIVRLVHQINASCYKVQRSADVAPTYGLTGSQFLGLGVPLVRRAIENLPQALVCMISLPNSNGNVVDEDVSPNKQVYEPSFRLPSSEDVRKVLQQWEQGRRARENKSTSGSCRADPFIATPSAPRRSAGSRKLLTKGLELLCSESQGDAVLEGIDAGGEGFDEEGDQALERENDIVLEAVRRERYIAMTRAYRRAPWTRLEVRRSAIHNWGLFARIAYEKDEVIVEYIGEKVRGVVADKREGDYERQGVGSCYLFR